MIIIRMTLIIIIIIISNSLYKGIRKNKNSNCINQSGVMVVLDKG